MAYFTWKEQKCPIAGRGTHWTTEVPNYSKTIAFLAESHAEGASSRCIKDRPPPEGVGTSGDPHRSMCQRIGSLQCSKSLSGHLNGSAEDRSPYIASGTGRYGPTGVFGDLDARIYGRKVACCDKCSMTLVGLKKQALSLAVHHHVSSKDPSAMSVFLHNNLRVHSSRSAADPVKEKDRDQGWCVSCGVHVSQLKQEAVHLALSRENGRWPGHLSLDRTGNTDGTGPRRRENRRVDEAAREAGGVGVEVVGNPSPQHGLTHGCAGPRTPERTPQTPRRRGPKPPNPDMNRWVEEQQQLVAVARTAPAGGGNGVSIYPYHQGERDVPGGHGDDEAPRSGPKMAHIARVATIANSAAMAFLARAAQKLNLRKRGPAGGPAGTGSSAHLSTCFRGLIEKNPPPVPPCVLQTASRTRDPPSSSQVRVVLRVFPSLTGSPARPPVLRVDPSRRRVTVAEPSWNSLPRGKWTQRSDDKAVFKTYNFDAVYPQESGQAEVCAGVLADVIRCVVSGGDGCVLSLGCADVGAWSTMVGSDKAPQELGLIPCSISWLYGAIDRRRERTWSDLNVSVSAVELRCGGRREDEETLRDLLAEVAPPTAAGSRDRPAAQVCLHQDSILGTQLRNHNRVKCPTAERAASLLDSAIASRLHGSQAKGGPGGDVTTAPYHSSVMFFTLHVQPPRTDLSTAKASRLPSRLTMIDVCSSRKAMMGANKSRSGLPQSELGSVLFSLLSGHKPPTGKGGKLAVLLREFLGHVNGLTTVIAQVSDLPANLPEALSTIHLVSRIRRTQKKDKPSAPCSPGGRSLGKDRRGHHSLSLRSFHSTGQVDVDIPRLRPRGELDERSGSDQSCDTVIHVDSDGSVQPRAAQMRVALARPGFVPIVPSLHHGEPSADDPELAALLQELLKIPQPQGGPRRDRPAWGKLEPQRSEVKPPERDCLKCETFAELQERLGCIDGSEGATDATKLPSRNPSNDDDVKTEPRPQKEAAKPSESPKEAARTLARSDRECPRTCASTGEKRPDEVLSGDSFQREDSGLYDCEEGSAASSTEEPASQSLGRGLTLRANCAELSDSGTQRSSSDSSGKEQSRAAPRSLALAPKPTESPKAPEGGDWLKPEFRTSPIGKSSPISPASPSSSPPSFARSVILGGILPHLPTDELKEIKATITVTVQQPLDQAGHDELVYSMVEEVTISGALDRDKAGRSIIRIKDATQSPSRTHGSACSQPIRIISNVTEESGPAEYSDKPASPSIQAVARESSARKTALKFKRENKLLPSFINPMLVETDCECHLEDSEPRYSSNVFFTSRESRTRLRQDDHGRLAEKMTLREGRGAFAVDNPDNKPHGISASALEQQTSCGATHFQVADLGHEAKPKTSGKRQKNTDRHPPRGTGRVYPEDPPGSWQGGEGGRRLVGNAPEGICASLGCLAAVPDALQTSSLPRCWRGASPRAGHVVDHRGRPGGVTSSSPRVAAERRQRGHRPSADDDGGPATSPARKTPSERRQEGGGPQRWGPGSPFKPGTGSTGLALRGDTLSELQSPVEQSGGLFSAKLRQLASRTSSLGRAHAELKSLDRGGGTTTGGSKGNSKDSTEVKAKGGSKGSHEEMFKGKCKRGYEGDSTLARTSRSPKKSPRCAPGVDPGQHSYPSPQSLSSSPSKLSAVGKLKMATPRVRRESSPGTKTLSFSRKGLRQAINRSASLSPDGKTFYRDQTPPFTSSSPPWSAHSLSRIQSQNSATKSPIRGVINGTFSDLLKDRETASGGPDKGTLLIGDDHPLFAHLSYGGPHPIPSPYSQVTAPQTPAHMSDHGSDVTSVLSGELPPAMGKTSLAFPKRSSVVSSGYESLLRDGEATGGGRHASHRDSVSDRGATLLRVPHSSRTSRRRGNSGPQHRRLSHDGPSSPRRSTSGPRASRRVERGLPEAFEIKVYEIDDVEQVQRRAGGSQQGSKCFSARLTFLAHRRQRVSEVWSKYRTLRGELQRAQQNLMLEPQKWNQEFDLRQTFQVDSLEHLEALEQVTSRLERRLNVCKANVMMVTSFGGVSGRRRQKTRRRTASAHQLLRRVWK